MTDPITQFMNERAQRIEANGSDTAFQDLSKTWAREAYSRQYLYNFRWLGRPMIQYPHDILIMQELIWDVQPDVIIETGIAHGGSLIFNASMMMLMGKPEGLVIGVDIDIRAHNRAAIEAHPLSKQTRMIEGSSIDPAVIEKVKALIPQGAKVMLILDSLHTHDHVLAELNAYAPLVSMGSYAVVQDTHVEDLPDELWANRPWSHGNSPLTAAKAYLETNPNFVVDPTYQNQAVITCARDGFLKRIA